EELFCHIFDNENGVGQDHCHIFECNDGDSAFLHLCRHLQKNDNNILALLSSQNNELFLGYFHTSLEGLVESHLDQFEGKRNPTVPLPFWKSHITTTFVGTLKWWIGNGMKESPEEIVEYFWAVV
ncbi:MAG: TetR family transcriptional regulator C-terminal domain-containing protein, partial [Oscillospiraceae bacterium]|nr:TetR family transcriptional regulator C-terminal domain-containing protein [Oscillospiraceae bacterium]